MRNDGFKRYPLIPVHTKNKKASILKDQCILKVETDLVTTGTSISAPELPPEVTMPIANPLCFSNHNAGADSDILTINDEPRPNIIPWVSTNCHIWVLNEASISPVVAITVPVKLAFLIPIIFTNGPAISPPQRVHVTVIVDIHAILSAGSLTNRTFK
ncbi:hypothetical protein AYI68_g2465 [Smittium mucronatum]|uniref:Uncharacterized protein n=1 Tax=Smittium mucronatum TaxID=133383 RepID=A0A1R0H2L0_9FUNG|nr:hypothetical protein AYI68_g2465 [Smittium mucronatum]